ncbi:MAG: hypothetical protein AAGH65_07055, partial [Pseudomonadota bacterium]
IRHNVGNKEQLLEHFVDDFLAQSRQEIDQWFNGLADDAPVQSLIEQLFDPAWSDPGFIQVSNALIQAAGVRPELSQILQHWTTEFIERIGALIANQYPTSSDADRSMVASGIAAMYFSTELWVVQQHADDYWANLKAASLILLQSLKQ